MEKTEISQKNTSLSLVAAYLAAFLIYINRSKNRIGEKAETV